MVDTEVSSSNQTSTQTGPQPISWARGCLFECANELCNVILALVIFACLLGTLFSLAGPLLWFFDLFSAFHLQYACLLGLTLLFCIGLGRWRLGVVAGVFLLVNLYILWPYAWASPPYHTQPSTSVQPLSIMQANVHRDLDDLQKLATYVEQKSPDLLFLFETRSIVLDHLQELLPNYELQTAYPRGDAFGIAAMRRHNAAHFRVLLSNVFDPTHGVAQIPAIEMTLAYEQMGEPIILLAMHAMPPINARYSYIRNAQIDAATEWSKQLEAYPHIVLGDFNATPWSAPVRHLVASTYLRPASQDQGLATTWPARYTWPMRIPIDHYFISAKLVCKELEVGPYFGSDHRPLLMRLYARE